ncbi:hypothetical protein FISHEDRAFT_55101 [Fistulina hepatica ATCC 64428]|uniref:Uncharacterized protein n=1 Tax=Fistulina hepatica ATCC 64428 TaxID=1128425 RepID=A0A0D7AQG6_9AGAR|nr:hypothetical protein FISHEDRAFT_55101 [Fistulina hepatica ATCC 64428]
MNAVAASRFRSSNSGNKTSSSVRPCDSTVAHRPGHAPQKSPGSACPLRTNRDMGRKKKNDTGVFSKRSSYKNREKADSRDRVKASCDEIERDATKMTWQFFLTSHRTWQLSAEAGINDVVDAQGLKLDIVGDAVKVDKMGEGVAAAKRGERGWRADTRSLSRSLTPYGMYDARPDASWNVQPPYLSRRATRMLVFLLSSVTVDQPVRKLVEVRLRMCNNTWHIMVLVTRGAPPSPYPKSEQPDGTTDKGESENDTDSGAVCHSRKMVVIDIPTVGDKKRENVSSVRRYLVVLVQGGNYISQSKSTD